MASTRRGVHFVALLGLCLLIVLVVSCPFSLIAIEQRVIAPPAFSVRLGRFEIAAPCPTRVFDCPHPMPWYAIWLSEERPNGGVHFEQLYFHYFPPARR